MIKDVEKYKQTRELQTGKNLEETKKVSDDQN